MADEITVNFKLDFTKGSSRLQIPSVTDQYDVAAVPKVINTQSIGTTHEALVTGDVSSIGVQVYRNLDTVNYVEIGIVVSGTFYPVMTLPAGEMAFSPRSSATLYAKANTAAVNLEYYMFSQ